MWSSSSVAVVPFARTIVVDALATDGSSLAALDALGATGQTASLGPAECGFLRTAVVVAGDDARSGRRDDRGCILR